mmetsp:Transcript_24163/g.53234  ORF Transcript_24163/g.53234 Transcript_24163/m.53234 type:complete len:245 (+) Transcript_24163:166-900(+)
MERRLELQSLRELRSNDRRSRLVVYNIYYSGVSLRQPESASVDLFRKAVGLPRNSRTAPSSEGKGVGRGIPRFWQHRQQQQQELFRRRRPPDQPTRRGTLGDQRILVCSRRQRCSGRGSSRSPRFGRERIDRPVASGNSPRLFPQSPQPARQRRHRLRLFDDLGIYGRSLGSAPEANPPGPAACSPVKADDRQQVPRDGRRRRRSLCTHPRRHEEEARCPNGRRVYEGRNRFDPAAQRGRATRT